MATLCAVKGRTPHTQLWKAPGACPPSVTEAARCGACLPASGEPPWASASPPGKWDSKGAHQQACREVTRGSIARPGLRAPSVGFGGSCFGTVLPLPPTVQGFPPDLPSGRAAEDKHLPGPVLSSSMQSWRDLSLAWTLTGSRRPLPHPQAWEVTPATRHCVCIPWSTSRHTASSGF